MPVNAPKDSSVDIGLPTAPLKCDDPKVNTELGFIYQALRNLQAAMNGDSFSAYLPTADQSITTDVYTKVALTAKEFDVNNSFDIVNKRFKPAVGGYYLITWTLFCSANAGTLTNAFSLLYKNGAYYKFGTNLYGVATTQFISNGATLVYLNGSTDYIELFGYIGGTSPKFIFGTYCSSMSGTFIRKG